MEEQLIYATLKHYTLYVAQLDLTVHARISKTVEATGEQDFEWSVSHYCQPSEGAGVYIPSVQSGNTFEETEALLFLYLKTFTALGVITNKHY